MTARLALAAGLAMLAASPALPSPDPSPGPLAAPLAAFEARRFRDVTAMLPLAAIQKLRRRDQPQAYFLLGVSHQSLGEADRALGVFQLAAGIFPRDVNLLSHLARLLHELDLGDRARPLYERVLRRRPNNAAAHMGLGELDHAHGMLERAAAHFQKALVDWKDNPYVWRSYAAALADMRRYPEAVAALRKAAELDPSDLSAPYSLANLHRRQGLKAEAYEVLGRVLASSGKASGAAGLLEEAAGRRCLWLLEDNDLKGSLRAAEAILRERPRDAVALWARAAVALREGRTRDAGPDFEALAGQDRAVPFAAAAARALMAELRAR